MRIAITGANGQLGFELSRQLGAAALPLDRTQCDLEDPASIRRLLELKPDAVINAAAYTQVDKAEQDVDRCRRINALAVGELAEVCRVLDCPLVQISTDYVFAGIQGRTSPFVESDAPQPLGVYAQTKWEAEQAAAQWSKHWISRTCGLYARSQPDRKFTNFVATMLRLGLERDELRIVDDQRCTPSYAPHVAGGILGLMFESPGQLRATGFGLYHLTNAGECSWYEFATEIFRQAEIAIRLERITTEQYGAPAPRPAYSVLDTGKIQTCTGIAPPDWRQGLRECLS